MQTMYKIKLKQFEGPFDLLLFFIERDELDIYDIPIAQITEQYLHYIQHLDQLNIDNASEFILVAATLMRIKAKMLIPRKEIDETGNEIDPRDELVQRLLEYKRYKSVLENMRDLEQARAQKYHRGNIKKELSQIAQTALVDVELESVSLFKIMRAFENVMEKFEGKTAKDVHHILQYQFTVKNQSTRIRRLLLTTERCDFETIFSPCENRIHAIVTFLSILELLHLQKIKMTQGIGVNNFWISIHKSWEEE